MDIGEVEVIEGAVSVFEGVGGLVDIVNGVKEELGGGRPHSPPSNQKNLMGCDSERFRYQPLRSPSVRWRSRSIVGR